jgi:hypothetical protein
MPQISFYVAGFSSGVGGMGLVLAWDRFDRGPSAADDIDTEGCGLYTILSPTIGDLSIVKMVTKVPIQIPEENCPISPDGFPQDFISRFELKPGGTALSTIYDLTFEVFEESTRIYGISPEGQSLKVEGAENSLVSSAVSFQDRLTLQPWEDPLEGFAHFFDLSALPSKEIWRSLMTPNEKVTWLDNDLITF